MKKKIMKTPRAFTLIELCIALSIAGILSMLGLFAFKDYQEFQKTTYIVHSLKQSLYYARIQAVFNQQKINITPVNNDWQKGWTIGFQEGKLLKKYPPMPLSITSGNHNQLVIQTDGTTPGSNMTIEINKKVKYVINNGGRLEKK